MLCQWNHPLAAISTMSWPELRPESVRRRPSGAFCLVVGKHPLAETTDSGPSGGRNYQIRNTRANKSIE